MKTVGAYEYDENDENFIGGGAFGQVYKGRNKTVESITSKHNIFLRLQSTNNFYIYVQIYKHTLIMIS